MLVSIITKHFGFVNSEYISFHKNFIIQLEVAVMTKAEQKGMADRIKNRREALGFTQEGFCEVINLSISSYTKIENAFQRPALDTLIKIAKHLDLSLDYIVFGDSTLTEVSDMAMVNSIIKNTNSEKLVYAGRFLNQMAKISAAFEEDTMQ